MSYENKKHFFRYCLSATMLVESLLVGWVTLSSVGAMGDRWAWADTSYRSQRKIETPGCLIQIPTDDKIIEFISAESVEIILPETNEEYVRNVRKVETKDTEPRNFIKDKLCAIGLADVSTMMQ